VLRTPREVRNAVAYVLLNARRHLVKRGLALPRVVRIDPASSGRWFTGWRCLLPAAPDPPAVSAPRTWLLSVGWRRVGLIDRAEVPGAIAMRSESRSRTTRAGGSHDPAAAGSTATAVPRTSVQTRSPDREQAAAR
jgi:hypothetical protein